MKFSFVCHLRVGMVVGGPEKGVSMPQRQLLIPSWRHVRQHWPHFQPFSPRVQPWPGRGQPVSNGCQNEFARGFLLRPHGQIYAGDAVSCSWPWPIKKNIR